MYKWYECETIIAQEKEKAKSISTGDVKKE